MTTPDKREYFRLSDQISVAYKVVTKNDLEEHNALDFFTSDPNFHLLRDIYELEIESAEIIRNISDSNRQLGSFLHNLNKRVELLSQGIRNVTEVSDYSSSSDTQISEAGVSFISDDLLKEGELLALKLLFLPSMLGLSCFAVVRYCRLIEDGDTYRSGVEFIDPDYATQKILGRHIIRRQSEERRMRLTRDESTD